MKALSALVLSVVLLAACETPGGMLVTYAAHGTRVEAERLVAIVYGVPGKPLPYAGGDIARALDSMRARWPQIRAELDGGSIGLNGAGFVVVRDASGRMASLATLVDDENRDRLWLYRAVSVDVGHGDESLNAWMVYTGESFGAEWIKQAPAGWWLVDAAQQWRRK